MVTSYTIKTNTLQIYTAVLVKAIATSKVTSYLDFLNEFRKLRENFDEIQDKIFMTYLTLINNSENDN